MNNVIRLLPVICLCAVTQAFAVDPPAPATAPSVPASTAAATNVSDPVAPSTAPPDSASAPANPAQPTKIVLEDKTLTNAEVAKLFAQGYKPVSRNGEVYYCRNEDTTGSRFKKMSCKTALQMQELVRDSKDMLTQKQLSSGCATNGSAC
jgi:hypothetical protein